ncbi:MAG: extracellular solute-binding protein [Nitrososphaerota archaeon]|nr:extracellular solute-binding protein [Nitrososphaerota archaeon]MDG6978234.1 extracellular solute-binding protein [Nitrososphaerota archaeon]MDG6981518.1 extracellular solute-binding protein [Nitrososphaerota archaeon]MDG7005385.1 extracellular solute-binding protein [Nitrososphaerota archaeon]MDG7021193.1 extracellular solute-binding protein [Nitrososphaerota archaeon]
MRTRRGVSTTVVAAAVVVIVIIVVGALVLASSGGKKSSSSSTLSSTTASSSFTVNETALYQQAKTEGSVVIYGSVTSQQFANITAAFNAVYPGITVDYVNLQPPQAIPRINSELATQGHSADIAFQGATAIYPLEQSGDAMTYVSPYASTFPSGVRDPLNQSTPIIELSFGWVYNTQMIQPANVPTTMAEVANAQFNGKVVMNDPTTGSAFTQYWAGLAGSLGNTTVYNFLHDLKNATNPTIVPTTTSCATEVATGAYAICLGAFMQEAAPDMQTGAPMRFLNITGLPLLTEPSFSMIVKNAPHPAAAELLTDFMASPAGQEAWGNINVRTPVSQTVTATWTLPNVIQHFDPGAGTVEYFPTPGVSAAATAWGQSFAFMK